MSEPTTENFPKPKSITGGCLCGSIRYRVDFPPDHDFIQSSASCQCTQCRRSTGTLMLVAHTVAAGSLTYVGGTGTSTLRHYAATPGFQRGFCGACGSLLYWRDEARDDLALAVGCVDEEALVAGGFGFALANLRGHHLWCQNEIPGVTDRMVGRDGAGVRWARNRGGVRM
ncbi:glutathione-dependent formaldehyde-activating GFA [Biscogniauxia sp. FL1348]|nr:glutathione-dependent formaldehyde-activating GFA [Biscogniauxia sp. FL1348]